MAKTYLLTFANGSQIELLSESAVFLDSSRGDQLAIDADPGMQDFVSTRVANALNILHSSAQYQWLQKNGFKYGHPFKTGCLFWSKKYSGIKVELVWKPSPTPFWSMSIRNDFDNYAHIWNFPDDYDFNGFNSIIAFFDKECQPLEVEENTL